MKKFIDPFDYAKEITHSIMPGILLTTKADGKVNTMTIGWGTLGVEWNKPIFTVYVRTSRFTHVLLEKNPEFTISVPYGAYDKKILGKAGVTSGRDVDKIKTLGLTLVEPEVVSVPAIKELPLTLECKVIFKNEQPLADITCDNVNHLYPQEVDDINIGRNKYPHTAYYGEIVSAYIIE
jgi:flavin reductase (DIM6/NTAB) family NADH-FMN oxidoreductase RutF